MPKLVISARLLFGYLEPPQTFAGWIRDATENYGYQKGEDWERQEQTAENLPWGFARADVMLSRRFAETLTEIDDRRRHEASKRRPVVEWKYPYPGEIEQISQE